MEGFEGNPGINKLANVLSQRMKAENSSPLILDFGTVQGDGSLVTDTFPVPLPKGQYSVCRHVGGLSFEISGGHSHTVTPPAIKPGDRVLVAWVQSEAVVVDIITNS
ncbi:hypothetical protein [Otoolea muris]|uniref:hypothetical protein n=1 Tax=Otoolea muris TaxID=2941515 RepID=UPI002040A804|nr:hypothetical protein [Otoolea muris]